jgi:hypothetical protein
MNESKRMNESKQLYNISYTFFSKSRVMSAIMEYSIFNITAKANAYAVVIVLDGQARLKYEQQVNALRCYAIRHHYIFYLLDPSLCVPCLSINNFFFKKHCGVLFYLIENPQIAWVLVLDGDNVLVNATKRIEDFIPMNNVTHVVHYERFYNGEIMAGNYLIRNHYWSYIYLWKWINLYKYLPDVYYHNNDNGALHLHLLLVLNKNTEIVHKCFSLWDQSTNEILYDQYVGCVKCALGGQRHFPHVQLLRRGHGFARDYREPENLILENDFLLHSFKNDTKLYYAYRIKPTSCMKNWEPPIHNYLIEHNLSRAKELIRHHDAIAAIKHPASVGWPDIGSCWPDCSAELDRTSEQQLRLVICK